MSASDDGLHVWGPSVATLDVHDLDHPGGARLVAMTRDATGTWHTPHRPAGRYWLVVDGDRLPDPGSTSQPFDSSASQS